MLSCLQHRGPDGYGTYVTPQVGLGHVRLSIIDVAEGHQPFVLGKHALSYNGEVFNYLEIREELRTLGETFRTNSDTEVLLKALLRWGLEALPKLNGQFAFLFWDGERRQLFAGRDRYGVRPLYFRKHAGALWFSSELKAYDAIPGLTRELCPTGVVEHGLFWNTLGTRTVYRDIECVEAGTCLVFDADGNQRTHRYHQLGDTPPDRPVTDFEEAKEGLRQRLTQAVSLRLRSDVPVGAYLSGGIDSSVTALLTDRLRTDRFKTFSIAFSDAAFDESSYQAVMAERLKTDRFTLTVGYKDIENHFEQAIWHGERPVFRTAPVPLLLLAEHVRASGIRVVLTGEGADEILWGYDAFKELKLLKFWAKHPTSNLRPQLIRTLYPHLAHYRDGKQFGLMRMFYEGFLNSYDNVLLGLNLRVHNNRILVNYLRSEVRPKVDDAFLTDRITAILPKDWERWSLLQRNQYLEMRTLLQGYLLSSQADRMSLAHGIEGRYPFLDPTVVEWVFHLPDKLKLPLLSQKHLLREAYRSELPESIVDRPKQPYQAPDLKAFFPDGKLGELGRNHLNRAALDGVGLFEPKMVERFLSKFEQGVPDQVGYRDNMIFCFLLSTQLAAHHAKQGAEPRPLQSVRTVDEVVES
jgi:asparagine synthase (glutamine-hydrolysing)